LFDAVILRISPVRATKLPGNPRFIWSFHRQFGADRPLGRAKDLWC